MTVFKDYARYYDLVYQDKDYQAETEFIDRLLQKHAPDTRTILELGCGTGNHAVLLAKSGYQLIHGIDLSAEMLVRARERSNILSQEIINSTRFDLGDIRTFRLEDKEDKFDAVISLFHVMSYQTTTKDLEAAFATAKFHLKSGGLFIFDCWYGPAVLSDLPTVRVKRLETTEILVTRIAEPVLYPNEDLVEVNYRIFIEDKTSGTIAQLRETHMMRYIFKHEVEYLFERLGIQLIEYAGWLNEREAGFDTWGTYFIGRA